MDRQRPAGEVPRRQPTTVDTDVYARGKSDPKDARKASLLSVPSARALSNRLALARALRPFTRRWRSTRDKEIDEEATVDMTASLGFRHPVLRAASERWYALDFVVEDDAAINVWRPRLREICQLARDTGAFQDVRLWQLRLTYREGEVGGFIPTLETSEGARISSQFLTGTGRRRLILFATHGCSPHWVDGTYKRVLEGWLPTAAVALLHMLPIHQWKRTVLGADQGTCHTARPGLACSLLDTEKFWWIPLREDHPPFVPIVALDALDIARFADMQMGRGRSASVVFLDTSRDDREAAEVASSIADSARIINTLKAELPDAFSLAVNLSSGPFTLPVARLIQEVKFGPDPSQTALAEILLSGLVTVRSPKGWRDDPDALYYDFYPEARAILMRSFRQDEAEMLAQTFKNEVSRYISAVGDRADKIEVAFPDEEGNLDLPLSVQAFARVGRSLLREPATLGELSALVRRFRVEAPPYAVRALATMLAGIPSRRDPEQEAALQALIQFELVRQDVEGHWHFRAGVEQALGIGSQVSSRPAEPAIGPESATASARSRRGTASTGALPSSGREVAVLRGHVGGVHSAVFSSNGGQVLTASRDGTARLWETASLKELAVLRGHESWVWSAVLSPDGARILTASEDKTARLWEAASGEQLNILRGHGNGVDSAVFSPDGARVLTASEDKTARLWETGSGRELAALQHQDAVWSAVLSPDGARILTASEDRTARLWDVESGRQLTVLLGHEGGVHSAVFSPDGKRILTASEDKTARLWDAESGRQLSVLGEHEGSVWNAVFSPNGARVLTASTDRTARLWEATSGEELAVLSGHEDLVYSAVFSPDGRRMLTASRDGTARLWEVESAIPKPLTSADLDAFCGLVTSAAGIAGGYRDYLMAVAYDSTRNLTDLGEAASPKTGPFQFTEQAWKDALAGPAGGFGFTAEARFDWRHQPTMAAILANDAAERFKHAFDRLPTFKELYFFQLLGDDALNYLKSPGKLFRDVISGNPPPGTFAAELKNGDLTVNAALAQLQKRLEQAYGEALKVINRQPPDIRFSHAKAGEPPWMAVAREQMAGGVSETPDLKNTADINAYFSAIRAKRDAGTRWCGAFVGYCIKDCGIPEIATTVTADAVEPAFWTSWGEEAPRPPPVGSIVVLTFSGSPQHVGFLAEGSTSEVVRVLGGSEGSGGGQPDRVAIVAFPAAGITGARWIGRGIDDTNRTRSSWNIDAVRSREAMMRVLEKNGPESDWGNVLVAHLDTGFTNHVVFNRGGAAAALRVADGLNFMDAGVMEPRDPLNYAGDLMQPGHGTRMLGVLCGDLPDVYTGVCPTLPVVPYRVTNSHVLNGQTIVNASLAIMDAVDRHRAEVISISLSVKSVFGNVKEMNVLGRAIDHAYNRGVIVVCAAGETQDAPKLVNFTTYPGRYSRSIQVGGIDAKRKICFDYKHGRKFIDVWAPAQDVRRPNSVFGQAEPFSDIEGHGDGTSYATVHVAGAAAMWLRMRSDELEFGGFTGWKRVEAFRAMLRATKQGLAGNNIPTKKPPTATGLLDCVALLDGKLPRLNLLKKAPMAERPQVN